jgi:hypothetical protein
VRQVAPATKRIAVLRDPALASGVGLFAVIAAVAPAMGVEVSVDITEFAQTPNGARGAFRISGSFIKIWLSGSRRNISFLRCTTGVIS